MAIRKTASPTNSTIGEPEGAIPNTWVTMSVISTQRQPDEQARNRLADINEQATAA